MNPLEIDNHDVPRYSDEANHFLLAHWLGHVDGDFIEMVRGYYNLPMWKLDMIDIK